MKLSRAQVPERQMLADTGTLRCVILGNCFGVSHLFCVSGVLAAWDIVFLFHAEFRTQNKSQHLSALGREKLPLFAGFNLICIEPL
jgi:hypothetical protein